MGKLTTHILDTSAGKPAGGVGVVLSRVLSGAVSGGGEVVAEVVAGEGERVKVGEYRTNGDGRVEGGVLSGEGFLAGVYELAFAVGEYFGGDCFYDVVTVRFVVKDASGHYHIPLLVSRYGYTTYRGS